MRAHEDGSVLVGVLWCLALLTVLVIGLLHASRTDLQVARHFGDRIQARYLAIAGIERAKALLYQDARERSRSGQSHNGTLFNAPQSFRDIPLGRGVYRVMRGGRPDEGGGLIYGVSDEESRLNANTAKPEDFGRLYGMTADIPPAIQDWRDGDNAASPGGADAEYYASLVPPSKPRNGPFQTLRELLMVRGMPQDLFLGTDPHLNGLGTADDGEGEEDLGGEMSAGAGGPGPSGGGRGADGGAGTGWGALLTVHSGVNNVSATGQERINVQTADETSLTSVRGITTDIAKAIVAYRGQNRLASIADLLDVPPAPPPGQPGQGGGPRPGFPPGAGQPNFMNPNANAGGGRVIDQNLLMDIADNLTTDGASIQVGVVNLNTAGLDVLACLPGMSRELAQAIISYRSSSGFFPNIAHLLRVPGVTPDLFKQLAPRVTARSETYRILAEGRVKSSGVRQRVEMIVRVGVNDLQSLSYREDDL